jgi:hypothetical protein
MPVGKKYSYILLICLIIAIVTAICYFFPKNKPVGINSVQAIPKSSAIIVKINGLYSLLNSIESNDYMEYLPDSSLKNSMQKFRENVDSLSENYSFLHEQFNDSSIYIVLVETKNKRIGIMLFFPIGNSTDKSKVTSVLKNYFNNIHLKISEYIPGLKVNYKNDTVQWNYYTIDGCLIISNTKEIMQESIHQVQHKNSLLSDNSFNKIYATTGKNVQGTIFINIEKFPNIVNYIIQPIYRNEIKNALSGKGWAAFDINIDRTFINFHGFSTNAMQKSLWGEILKIEQPAESPILEFIPKSTLFYGLSAYSDPYNYQLALKNYAKENPSFIEKSKILNENYSFKVKEKLFDLMGNVVAKAKVDLKNGHIANFCIVKTKDAMNAVDFISILQKKIFKTKAVRDKMPSIQEINIVHLPDGNIPNDIFGNAFEKNEYNYVCNYKYYLLFSKSEENINLYLSQIKNDQNILNDSTYKSVSTELIATKANISLYYNINKSWEELKPYFVSNVSNYLDKNILNSKVDCQVGVQVSGNGEYLYNNIFLHNQLQNSSIVEKKWTLQLDTSLAIAPIPVTNLVNNLKYILVQDKSNSVYLLTEHGKLIWKKHFDRAISGNVYAIDYSKNNKLQFLFNTENNIYNIDLSGKSIKGFPLKLKQKASNSIAVADFDKNKNYRIYIAFENGTLNCLSKEGRKVEGWKVKKDKMKIFDPVQTFTWHKKDYLFFTDNHKINVINRRGQEAITIKNDISVSSKNQIFTELLPNFFKIIFTDSLGVICSLYPDGHIDRKAVGRFSPTHSFVVADMNGNGKNDYIFADSGKVSVFSDEFKLLASVELPDSVENNLIVRKNIKGEDVIFIFNNKSNQLYKLNKQWKIAKGFPMNGKFPLNIISLSFINFSFAVIFEQSSLLSFYMVQ